MKKSIFLFFAAILCAMSVQGAASKQFNNQQFLYCIVENTNWNGWGIKYNWYWDSGSWCAEEDGTKISENHWYAKVPNEYIGGVQFIRCSKDLASKWDWSVTKNSDTRTDNKINCAKITGSDWGNAAVSWTTYAPPMSSVTLADNGTTVNSGTGTQADPYIIEIGTKIKVQASGTKAVDDPDAVINYAFKYGATSQDSETTTWEIDANSPSTTYAIELEGYTKVNTTSSEKKAATKLYYQTVADATLPTYQVTVTANDPAMGTVTGAGEYSEGATAELTATPNDGYKFVNWTVGSTEKSTNPTYSFTVAENVTLVANFQAIPEETVYFINTNKWTGTINAYAWTDGSPKVENAGWAGLAATKEDFQIGGYDVYSYTAKQGLYANVIFNGTGGQTTDLTWSDGVGKYYAPSKSKWYDTKEAAAEALAAPVEYDYVYFINTNSWADVNIYTWNSEIATWPGVAMNKEAEQIAGFDVYSYKVVKGTSFGGMKFNEGQDKAQTGDLEWEAGKYYAPSTSEWYADVATAEAALAAVVTYDYYIVGSFNGDNPKKAENGMTLDGTVYKATVTLAEGDNTLKVTDGTWENTWGANELGAAYEEVSNPNDGYNNIKITLAAEKEITVIFDATAGKITFEGLTINTTSLTYRVEVPERTEKCFIAGPCGVWDFQEMTREGETDIFTITIVGAKETDEYKYACQADWAYAEVIDGGGNRTTWTELDKVEKWGKPAVPTLMGIGGDWTTGIEMTINPDNADEYILLGQVIAADEPVKIKYGGTWCAALEETSAGTIVKDAMDQDNISLTAGTYDFYYKKNDNKVYIAAATPYTRDVRQGYYGTICLPTAGQMVGASIFEIAYKDASKIYFDEIVSGKMEAGVPYIFLPNEGVTTLKVFYTEMAVVAAGSKNGLVGSYTQELLEPNGNNYILLNNQYCKVIGEAYVGENRAYFQLGSIRPSAFAPAPGVRRVSMGMAGQNTATGVDQVQGDEVPTKMIINGQLYILRGEKMYDAQGKLVK